MLKTSEGYEYTPSTGLRQGLPTAAVVSPPQLRVSTAQTYDVIVIGAGFAGIISARDLLAKGYKVLLIEARDRIGGRTWTTQTENGDYLDIGGTYIHWAQPHFWVELVRYGLKNEVKNCREYFQGSALPVTFLNGEKKTWEPHELHNLLEKCLQLYYNPDGERASDVVPLPHSPLSNIARAVHFDKMSAADRFSQLKGELNEVEIAMIEAFTMAMCGPPLEEASYFDLLQRWVLGGGTSEDYNARMVGYKLKRGQTSLLRAIFDEISSNPNLSWTFSTPVQSIDTSGLKVASVVAANGNVFHARKVICTIPLMVLRTIKFVPELPIPKAEAIASSRSNLTQKVHAVVDGKEWRSWTGVKFVNNGVTMMSGDPYSNSTTTTNLVVFTAGDGRVPRENPQEQLEVFQSMDPSLNVSRLVFGDFNNDPYARGSWCLFQPKYMTRYLSLLQCGVGNLKFASGDISDGWRGFIDGAIESATLVAKEVDGELKHERTGKL